MISLPQGFRVGAPEAIDSRMALTKEEMKAMKDALMPQLYFTICKDDSNIYIYNKVNEVDEEIGKFRLYSAGSEENSSSKPIDIEKIQTLFKHEEEEEWQI